MSKYIVKNCPAYGVTTPTSCALTSDDSCEFTDCPIKRVAEITSAYYDIYCNHCVTKNCDGCHFDLAKQILQTLQVEEVE